MTSKSQKEVLRQCWVENTQMFQRIAGSSVTPADQLGLIYDQEQIARVARRSGLRKAQNDETDQS